ncbi:hypothetical protein OROGR_015835 [Orobanche gracilis]
MAAEQGVITVIRPSRLTFRGPRYKIAFTVHSSFLAAGYILTAAGTSAFSDSVLTSSFTDEVGTDGWDQFDDNYAFVYSTPDNGSKKISVKCLAINDTLLVHVLKNGDKEPLHLKINVNNYIAENGSSNYGTQFKDLGELLTSINGILGKLSAASASTLKTAKLSVNNYIVKNGGSNYSKQFKDLGELLTSINNGILGKLSAPPASSLEAAKPRTISRIINRISRMSWADLPVDILFIIFGFLHDMNIHNLFDLYQCLAVCRSWRFVVKQIWQTRILPTTPWLLFHIDRSKKIFFKTNLHRFHEYPPSLAAKDNDASLSCTLNLFHLQTYASYDGWLLLGNSGYQPFLYNPITALLLQLPPLPPWCPLHLYMKFVSSGASPTDHNCIICIRFSNKRERMNHDNTSLLFCRPAVSTSWVVLKEKAEDFIFNGGKFYSVGSGGDLFVYNSDVINGNTSCCIGQPWKNIKIAEAVFDTKSLPRIGDCCCCFYLVESKHRELLMIMRTADRKNYITKSFRTFMLNRSDNNHNGIRNGYHYYWKEISSLPEKESIILLWNEGMSISVDDHNGYKSNSIYFYDEEHWGQTTTYGIYDLGSCEINYKTEDSNCLYPKLFTPSKLSDV